MLRVIKEHFFLSGETKEILATFRILKTPYVVSAITSVIAIYTIVSLAIILFG